MKLLPLAQWLFYLRHLFIFGCLELLFWISSLLFFYKGLKDLEKRKPYFYAFTAFLSLAVLTKGIAALALIGPIIIAYLTVTKEWKSLKPLYLPTNLLLFLAITAPWHILVSLKNPDFSYKYFIFEHFLRYSTTVHGRYQPMWFFIPILIAGLFIWVGL